MLLPFLLCSCFVITLLKKAENVFILQFLLSCFKFYTTIYNNDIKSSSTYKTDDAASILMNVTDAHCRIFLQYYNKLAAFP